MDPSGHQDYGLDVNGSVEELQGTDGEAVAGTSYLYDPYGETENGATVAPLATEGNENPFRFEGFYYDSGVKTYDMHARQYRPDVGRFLTQDRFEAAGADLELQSDPLTQNRYAFAGGNPVNRVEFDGHVSPGDLIKRAKEIWAGVKKFASKVWNVVERGMEAVAAKAPPARRVIEQSADKLQLTGQDRRAWVRSTDLAGALEALELSAGDKLNPRVRGGAATRD